MSKWSSYKEQQQLHEGWRRFLNEDAEPSGGENLEESLPDVMVPVRAIASHVARLAGDRNAGNLLIRVILGLAWAAPFDLKRHNCELAGSRPEAPLTGVVKADQNTSAFTLQALEESGFDASKISEDAIGSLADGVLKVLPSISGRGLPDALGMIETVNETKKMIACREMLGWDTEKIVRKMRSQSGGAMENPVNRDMIENFQNSLRAAAGPAQEKQIADFDPMSLEEENK